MPTNQNNYKNEKKAKHKMREKWQNQMPLINPASAHPQARELKAIDAILKNNPTIFEIVDQELHAHRGGDRRSGARGMSAEQVLRAALVTALDGFTCR